MRGRGSLKLVVEKTYITYDLSVCRINKSLRRPMWINQRERSRCVEHLPQSLLWPEQKPCEILVQACLRRQRPAAGRDVCRLASVAKLGCFLRFFVDGMTFLECLLSDVAKWTGESCANHQPQLDPLDKHG